jgi:hypothetical protein
LKCTVFFTCFFLVVVVEFELRNSHLLGRCSTTWAPPPAHVHYFWIKTLMFWLSFFHCGQSVK